VSPEDADALSMALLKLLKNRNLMESFSRLGKLRAEEFAVKKIVAQYEDIIYRSLFPI
jgi:glycosyltransferase involved in cell wall biosynthesis